MTPERISQPALAWLSAGDAAMKCACWSLAARAAGSQPQMEGMKQLPRAWRREKPATARGFARERNALALRSGERRGARGLRGDGRELRAPLGAPIRLDRPHRVGNVNIDGRYRRHRRIQAEQGRRVGRWLLIPHLHPAVIESPCDSRSSRPRPVAATDREGGDIDTPASTRRKAHVCRQRKGRTEGEAYNSEQETRTHRD